MSSHVHLSSQQIPVTALETQEEGCKVEPDISEQLNITPRGRLSSHNLSVKAPIPDGVQGDKLGSIFFRARFDLTWLNRTGSSLLL